MEMSVNSWKTLTQEELWNMVIEYQHKCDNILSKVNTELTSLKERFYKNRIAARSSKKSEL